MENISGYARVLARVRVGQQVNKPFLGKPYLKYGQCLVVWPYFFQLGGVLGAKHASNLDDFGRAFLGMRGPPGSLEKCFTEMAKRHVADARSESFTFFGYIAADFIRRVDYADDASRFFSECGMKKLPSNIAEEQAWLYSVQGSALGAIYPHIIKRMFDQTYAAVPKENWERLHYAGLNIPPEQDLMNYEETEEGENEAFMDYCRECCPDLYSILSK